ncbi:MAG: SnoaL-like domain-containing protein [Opitutales bacterium]|jgi:sugar phosphate isomerase/epimerase|nr:SnoaL-like domain-containing protein [Opitutales bacterium]MBT5815695.1 SnoaL-like domain-containing protein [Opitutales bacterium]
MKRIPSIFVAFFALTLSSIGADMPLSSFDFDFARLGEDEASQVKAVHSIGYSGLVQPVDSPKHLEKLKRYQAAIGDGPFKVTAGLFTVNFSRDLGTLNAHLDKVIQALKISNAPLWLIPRDRKDVMKREQIVAFVRSAAEKTKAAGIELVLYPHYGDKMETVEEMIPFLKEVQNGNVYISLHLCHELRAGNGDRLDEIAAKIKPWLRLPSINGSESDVVNDDHEAEGWKRAIQPLTQGDYDSSKLLKALRSVGYNGPVVLHTFGLQAATADHHHTSFKKYQEMVAELEPKSPSLKRSDARFNQPQVPKQSEASRLTPDSWRKPRQKIRSASLREKIDYLLDRAEIEDIITAYGYSVDTRDYPLHGELFKDSFPLRVGDRFREVENQWRLDRMEQNFKRFSSTQHLGFPLVIQIEEDTAYATASLHARHYDATGDPLDNTLLFGQYEFWFERTSEGWKVSKLAQVNRTRINTSEAEYAEED